MTPALLLRAHGRSLGWVDSYGRVCAEYVLAGRLVEANRAAERYWRWKRRAEHFWLAARRLAGLEAPGLQEVR